MAAGRLPDVHCLPCTSHVQRLPSASNENDRASAAKVIAGPLAPKPSSLAKGSRAAVTGLSISVDNAPATAAGLKAGALVPFTASTRKNSAPFGPVLRYQKRSPGNHVARTGPLKTSGVVL